jgi:DNA invertase Pin-like site-specific DNA recombinase
MHELKPFGLMHDVKLPATVRPSHRRLRAAPIPRQIMGVFSQLEKTRLVKKLKAARDRKRANGKVEGRQSHLEARPEVVAVAKRPKRESGAACARSPPSSLRLATSSQWPALQRQVG